MARAVQHHDMKKAGRTRRLFSLLPVRILIALLAVVLADGLIWLATTESITFIQEGEIQFLDLAGGSYKRCSWENGYYSTDDSSPQILLKAPKDQTVGSMIIHLSQPLAQDTTIRVYYTKKGEKQSNDHSERITAYAGLTELALNIPADQYNHLRFRIKGNMYMDRISVSDGAAVQQLRPLTFRWIRILAIFLPLALMLCLYQFSAGFRSAMQMIDRKVIQPDTRWKAISIGYGIFACGMILSNVYRMIYWKSGLSYTPGDFPLEIPWYVFAILGILLGRMWRTKTFWIFLSLLAWQYFRLAIPDYAAAMSERNFYLNSLYLYFGCFSIGRALPPTKNKWFISLACIAWTLMMLVYDGFGLYIAWNGTMIPNLGDSAFSIELARLFGIYHSMVCGVLAGASSAVVLVGIHLTRRKSLRLASILAYLVIVFTGVLSIARTGYVLVAFSLATVICLHLYEKLFSDRTNLPRADWRGNPGGTFWRWATVCLLFTIILVGVTFIQGRTLTAYVKIRERGVLISNAMAEAATGTSELIQPRVFLMDSPDAFLNGRLTIWSHFFQILKENPSIQLWGESIYNPMVHMDELRTSLGIATVAHLHNELFEMILESGIPGGVLYICFALSVVIPAVKLFIARRLPFWIRLLPLPMLCCFLAETVDCTCKIETMHPQTTLLYLFAGFALAAAEYAMKRNN